MEKNYELDLKQVGRRIRNARSEFYLTQEKAAECAGITSQFWSLVETGKLRASVNTYLQIAAVLGVTLNDIFYNATAASHIHDEASKDKPFSDCTATEKAMIGEMLIAFKNILQRYRSL